MKWYEFDHCLYEREINSLRRIDPEAQVNMGTNGELIVSMSTRVEENNFKMMLTYSSDYAPHSILKKLNVEFIGSEFVRLIDGREAEFDRYINSEFIEGRITSGGDMIMSIRSWIKSTMKTLEKNDENSKRNSFFKRDIPDLKYVDNHINDNCNLVVVSDRAYRQLVCQTLAVCGTNAADGVETGGVLIGHFVDGFWYVVESIDQGVETHNSRNHFKYDVDYINHQIEYLSKIYKHPLTLLGVWHRHPASMDYFSGTDEITIKKHVDISKNGILSMLVNIDPDFRMTFYYCGKDDTLMKTPYVVGDEYFIKDLLEYRRLKDVSEKYGNVKFVLPPMPSPDDFVHSLEERENGRQPERTVNAEKQLDETAEDNDVVSGDNEIERIVNIVLERVMKKLEAKEWMN